MAERERPGGARPSDRLLALMRDARLDGAEPDFADSAKLLRAVAGDPVEMNALLYGVDRTNEPLEVARTLGRHARAAASEMQREIERLTDREAGVLFWGQSIGASASVAALIGFATGAIATGGALAIPAAGALLFGAATAERVRSGAEKDRLRRGRDDLAQLTEELAKKAADLERGRDRPHIG